MRQGIAQDSILHDFHRYIRQIRARKPLWFIHEKKYETFVIGFPVGTKSFLLKLAQLQYAMYLTSGTSF